MSQDQAPFSPTIRSLVIEYSDSPYACAKLSFRTSERDSDACSSIPCTEWDCATHLQIFLTFRQSTSDRHRLISRICGSMPLVERSERSRPRAPICAGLLDGHPGTTSRSATRPVQPWYHARPSIDTLSLPEPTIPRTRRMLRIRYSHQIWRNWSFMTSRFRQHRKAV